MTGGPLVLVEGDSDAAVVRLLAGRHGLPDLRVLPTGGAMGTRRALAGLEQRPATVLALCDEREAPHVQRTVGDRESVFICRTDLEDELIRALGVEAVLAVLEDTRDLRPFRTLQRQPEHRGRPAVAQLRRFIAAGAGRKARIDQAMAAVLEPGEEPAPLRALLTQARSASAG